MLRIPKPKLEIFTGDLLDFRRQLLETLTKAFFRRGNHQGVRPARFGFLLAAAHKERRVCRFVRPPRFGGPTRPHAVRVAVARVRKSPRGAVLQLPARFPGQSSCIELSFNGAAISSLKGAVPAGCYRGRGLRSAGVGLEKGRARAGAESTGQILQL